MANRPIDLVNFNAADANNPDGTLKDQVYSAPGVVSQVGSEAKASFITDLLSVFQWLVRENGDSLSGVTDSQAASQFIDAFVNKINNTAVDAAFQVGLSSPREFDFNTTILPPVGDVFEGAAYGNSIWVFTARGTNDALGSIVSHVSDDDFVTGNGYEIAARDTDEEGGALVYDGTSFIAFQRFTTAQASLSCYVSTGGITWLKVLIENPVEGSTTFGVLFAGLIAGKVLGFFENGSNGHVTVSGDGGSTWVTTANIVTGVANVFFSKSAWSDTHLVVGFASASADYAAAKYTTNGTTYTACTGLPTTGIGLYRCAVYNGERFILTSENTNDYFVSDVDDPSVFTAKEFPFVAGTVDTAYSFNGLTVVHDRTSGLLFSATKQGVIDEDWQVHPYPFPVSGGAIIPGFGSTVQNENQVVTFGNTLEPGVLSITPPIKKYTGR